jgi:hypothetical protein
MIKKLSTTYLDQKYIYRLELFFKKKSVKECCDEVNIESAAYREGMSKTVEALRHFYGDTPRNGCEGLVFQGSMKSSKDILQNEFLIVNLLCSHRDKVMGFKNKNTVTNNIVKLEDKRIADLTVREFKELMAQVR